MDYKWAMFVSLPEGNSCCQVRLVLGTRRLSSRAVIRNRPFFVAAIGV